MTATIALLVAFTGAMAAMAALFAWRARVGVLLRGSSHRTKVLAEALRSQKQPANWLCGGHLQTVLGIAGRPRLPLAICRREELKLPSGGSLVLDWLADPRTPAPRGVLIIVPGTSGSCDSAYVQHTARAAAAAGYTVVVAPLRGSGIARLASPHCIDGAHFSDIGVVVKAVAAAVGVAEASPSVVPPMAAPGGSIAAGRCRRRSVSRASGAGARPASPMAPALALAKGSPAAAIAPVDLSSSSQARPPIVAMGFSMGAGMLAHYLADCGQRGVASGVDAAVAISATADYGRTVEVLHTTTSGMVYSTALMSGVRKRLLEHQDMFAGTPVDVQAALKAKTVREWHAAVTCPLRGIKDSAAFCTTASYAHLLTHIETPTLFINAEDDPICPADTIPVGTPLANPNVAVLRTTHGGHCGFFTHGTPLHVVQQAVFGRAAVSASDASASGADWPPACDLSWDMTAALTWLQAQGSKETSPSSGAPPPVTTWTFGAAVTSA